MNFFSLNIIRTHIQNSEVSLACIQHEHKVIKYLCFLARNNGNLHLNLRGAHSPWVTQIPLQDWNSRFVYAGCKYLAPNVPPMHELHFLEFQWQELFSAHRSVVRIFNLGRPSYSIYTIIIIQKYIEYKVINSNISINCLIHYRHT